MLQIALGGHTATFCLGVTLPFLRVETVYTCVPLPPCHTPGRHGPRLDQGLFGDTFGSWVTPRVFGATVRKGQRVK